MENYIFSMRVLFRGLEESYLICDINVGTGYTITDSTENTLRKYFSKLERAKLKLQDNNIQLLEKVKSLKKRRLIWITYQVKVPLEIDVNDMLVVQVLTNDEYLERKAMYKAKEKELI